MAKLNPAALAGCGDANLDAREGVQATDAYDIKQYVIDADELPEESAGPFAEWLDQVWNDWNEDGDQTIGRVIAGALEFWRGKT